MTRKPTAPGRDGPDAADGTPAGDRPGPWATGAPKTSADPRAIAWGVRSRPEPRWPVELAVVCAIVIQLFVPSVIELGARWPIPVLEAVAVVVIGVRVRAQDRVAAGWVRALGLGVVGLISLINVFWLVRLAHLLVSGSSVSGRALIYSAVAIWVTNVIAFALWYWEVDRGGPVARSSPAHREPDFLFPQMSVVGASRPDWTPGFVDYLYTSFTNCTAFSPTDTMPLTPLSKWLMLVESLTSFITVAVVAGHAVNILA